MLRPERGEKNRSSKTQEAKVREIRRKWKSNQYTQVQLAEEYGLSNRTISAIVRYKTWWHVED